MKAAVCCSVILSPSKSQHVISVILGQDAGAPVGWPADVSRPAKMRWRDAMCVPLWAAARRQGAANRSGVKLVFVINSSNEGPLGNNAYTQLRM
ncbi:hypothetical protein HaLaN_08321 [Haematococcus lacustris]|uniref:Uncharacterized protein n=1 Tax=Haematococcus lacustris TaxID=44745 RepID=A0A699Z031_HAELA|nr:hypothetical protein HaLaN_08321 [Haematococcus lacustris]